MREAEALVDLEGSSSDRLRKFVNQVVDEYKRFEKLLPLAYEFVALAARSKSVRETVVIYFERYMSILSAIIQQGINSGEFKPCDPELVATSLIAMYEGIALLWFIEPKLVDWDEMEHEPIELMLAGLSRESN
jgi:AcrR family transcriptional regulator